MHRDINLSNLMLKYKNDFSSLKLINFSSAEYIQQKNTKVPPKYSASLVTAPELSSLKTSPEKIDIFSAGVILYLLLTGKQTI